MKVKLYTIKGEAKTDVNLPKEYDSLGSTSLVNQAVRVYEDRTHFGLNKVKTRSEINATKKKLYKQKGTGGARHGAKSAHIFVGGGVAHGPKGVKRDLNLPSKMKKKALEISLTRKFKLGKAVLVEGLSTVSKTKDANKILVSLNKVLNNSGRVTLVLAKENIKSRQFYSNIKNLIIKEFSSLNAFDVVTSNVLVIDSASFKVEAVKSGSAIKKEVKKEVTKKPVEIQPKGHKKAVTK